MNKLKKTIIVRCITVMLLTVGFSFSITGCSDSTKEEANNTVGIANPMVSVKGVEDFSNQLGIDMDDSMLPANAEYFIISNELAEIQYKVKSVDDEDVDITYRAKKIAQDSTSDNDISGIYDDNMTESTIEYGSLSLRLRTSDSLNANIYDVDFYNEAKQENIRYCVVIIGNSSQMQIANIMDIAMATFKLEN